MQFSPLQVEINFGSPLVIQVEVADTLPPSGSVEITASIDGFQVTSKGPEMAYTLPADKQVTLKVEFLDAKGNHATIDGDPEWSSSNDEVATATATPGNPFIAQLLPVAPGTCQVKVEADADLGDGVREVLCTMDVEIVGGEAVVGVISPTGEPTPPSPGGPG